MNKFEARTFLESFFDRYRSATARSYTYDVKSFAQWLTSTEEEAIAQLLSASAKEAHLLAEQYKISMATVPELTMKRRLSTLRNISRYAYQEGLIAWFLVTNSRTTRTASVRKETSGPSDDLVDHIRARLSKETTVLAKRDLAIIDLFYWRGMRAQEVPTLELSDLDLERDQIRLCTHRRSTKDWFPMPAIAVNSLSGWLKVRPPSQSKYVFIRLDRAAKAQVTAMSGGAMRVMIARRAKESGIEMIVTPRGLFRSAVTRAAKTAANRKLPFTVVRDFARHQSAESTHGRINPSEQQLLF